DRIVFWSVFAVSLLSAAAYGGAAARWHWKPTPELAGLPPFALAGFAVLYAFITSLLLAGLAAALRTWLALRAGQEAPADWMSRAAWGSLGWWGLLLATLSVLIGLMQVKTG